VDSLPRKRSRSQQKLCVRAECPAGVGNDQASPGARKQLYCKGLLQRFDAGADRGLADAQGFRGTMKAAESSHREKSLNLIKFHTVFTGYSS
jgi:hypothetical protein